jgi:hypothetical protein
MEDVKEILGDSVLEVHESERLLSLEKEPWTKGAQASFGGKG